MAGYTLASLIPEPFIVTDPAGGRYEAKMVSAFGAAEYARYERLSREFEAAWATIQGADGDREAAGAAVDRVLVELVADLLPTMPEARRAQLTFGERLGILQAWQEAQPAAPGPKLAAGGRPTRGRRSPASSTPATTRSAS